MAHFIKKELYFMIINRLQLGNIGDMSYLK